MTINERGERIYATDEIARQVAKQRRDDLVCAGFCINGKSHGRATHGVRCEYCYKVHRGEIKPRAKAQAAHCKRGHPYNAENTRTRGDGSRECLTCRSVTRMALAYGVSYEETLEIMLAKSGPKRTTKLLAPSL